MQARSVEWIKGLALACAVTVLTAACSKPPEAVPVTPANSASPPPAVTTATSPAATTVGMEIDDSVVTARVKAALLGNQDVKSFEIKVETRKGLVQLSGFVDTQQRIDSTVALVRGIEGVKDVENGMVVKEGTATVGNTLDDSIITAKVKSALLGDPAVNGSDIGVATRKGEVQLSGYVSNQNQIDRALVIARTVEGVHNVNNEMSVKK